MFWIISTFMMVIGFVILGIAHMPGTNPMSVPLIAFAGGFSTGCGFCLLMISIRTTLER